MNYINNKEAQIRKDKHLKQCLSRFKKSELITTIVDGMLRHDRDNRQFGKNGSPYAYTVEEALSYFVSIHHSSQK